MTDSFTLLRPALPVWLERRVIRIAPRATVAYDDADWRGALAVLELGSVVLEAVEGQRVCLDEGAVLCLAGLALVAILNERNEPAVIALARRRSVSVTP